MRMRSNSHRVPNAATNILPRNLDPESGEHDSFQDQKQSHFFRLPTELRLMVWRYAGFTGKRVHIIIRGGLLHYSVCTAYPDPLNCLPASSCWACGIYCRCSTHYNASIQAAQERRIDIRPVAMTYRIM